MNKPVDSLSRRTRPQSPPLPNPTPGPTLATTRRARPDLPNRGIPAGAVTPGRQLGGTHTQAHACKQLHTARGAGHSGLHHNTPRAVESVGPCHTHCDHPPLPEHRHLVLPGMSSHTPSMEWTRPGDHSGCGPGAERSRSPRRPDPQTHRSSTIYRSVWRSHLSRDRLWCCTVVTDSSTVGNGGCPILARGTSTAQPPPPCAEACGWYRMPSGTH